MILRVLINSMAPTEPFWVRAESEVSCLRAIKEMTAR